MDSLKEHNERVLSSEFWLDPDTHSQISDSDDYDKALIELCKYYGAADNELDRNHWEDYVITRVYEDHNMKLHAFIISECKDEVDYLTEFSFISYVDFNIKEFIRCVYAVEQEADLLNQQVNDIVIGE